MPAVARLGDLCSGHEGFPPRPASSGSGDVFVNMLPVHRQGDSWAVHCCVVCHGSSLTEGSPSVFVNNIPIGRVGDAIECGSEVATGSPNVFADT